MELNPYAKFLGAQDARAVIAATPGLVHQLVSAMSAEQVTAPIAEGKWSPCEIVAHLADCEIVFSFRLRQTLAMESPVIQPFDQDDWARNYGAYNFRAALTTYQAVRAWNLAFIQSLTDEQKAQVVTHPERGTMTVWTIVETMAGHDRHHLAGLEKLENVLAS